MEILYTGETLKMKDTIKEGIFKGEKVGKVIKTYGKKGIWDILKSYDLDEEILKKYHFHKKKDEQKEEMSDDEDPYEEYVGDPNPCPQNDDVSIFGPWPGDRNCFL